MNQHAMATSASLQFRMLVDLCYFGASDRLEASGAAPNNPRRGVSVWVGIIGLPDSGVGGSLETRLIFGVVASSSPALS